jgi:type II secretory pathway pseudopilin PulG
VKTKLNNPALKAHTPVVRTSLPFINTPLQRGVNETAAPELAGHYEVPGPRVSAGFSLIEIMVAVGLLSFIILGLLMVFSQTQRAFRVSMTQTDVLEGGRSIMEMISREVEQAAPCHSPDFFIGNVRRQATNFFTEFSNLGSPLIQDLPGAGAVRPQRTNYVQRFFFLTKVNQDWIGTGYELLYDDPNGWVGSLYRWSMTNRFRPGPIDVSAFFLLNLNATNPYMSRIADNVVHLRVRPFAANGFPIVGDGKHVYPVARTNALTPADNVNFGLGYGIVANTFLFPSITAPDRMLGCYFFNNAMPAAVEIELGLLEPRVVQRYRSIPVSTPAGVATAREYLSRHAGEVHLFKQRIPIRNADPSVFP